MATIVLVHGAWHGGWCWSALEPVLRALGHETHAPTLTGLGDRSHLLTADITPDTHALDVANFIRWRELGDVILVGHSYGGAVISGAVGLVPDAISALIYLDAVVPEESRVSKFGRADPDRFAAFKAKIDAGMIAVEPDNFDAWTDDPLERARLERLCTPQPARCLTDGVTLTGAERNVDHKHYILCSRNHGSIFWSERDRVAGLPDWTCHEIATLHNAMVEAPDRLGTMLDDIARSVT